MTLTACTVNRLRLHHFRNYTETTVHFHAGLNLITGRNAQGKTNLLEAVATLALTRSPRAASSAELVQWDAAGCQLEADITRPGGPVTLRTRLEREATTGRISRRVTVDGKRQAARAVLGLCPVVLFWPDDLQLVKGGPDGRRRLLDVMLVQLDANVAAHLARYRHVLDQRNALLHRLRAEGRPAGTLTAFSRELAHHGARVVVARQRLIGDLQPHAAAALSELSDGRERLSLQYVSSCGTPAYESSDQAELHLLAALESRVSEEIARASTLSGPHRDDVEITLDGRPARHSASQGQQRSIVLACKIAEMRFVAAAAGMQPVVMLDDVVSELDAQRREHLLGVLAEAQPMQVLLTTTEPLGGAALFASVRNFSVAAGTVTPLG